MCNFENVYCMYVCIYVYPTLKSIYVPGLQDFCWHNIPKQGKFTKQPKNQEMSIKKLKLAIKYTNLFHARVRSPPRATSLKKTTFSIPMPSKIYPNWDFWLKNKQSGNPGMYAIWSFKTSHKVLQKMTLFKVAFENWELHHSCRIEVAIYFA
jgi:hypothetical protein